MRQLVRNMSSKGGIRVLPPRIPVDGTRSSVSNLKKLSQKTSWFEWLRTSECRRLVMAVNCTAAAFLTAGLIGVKVLSTSYAQSTYSELEDGAAPVNWWRQMTQDEEPIVVKPSHLLVEMSSLLQERAGLNQKEMDHLEMFQTTSLDPVVIGTTKSKMGASVGLPYSMMCTTKDDLDLTKVIIKPYWNLYFKGFRIPQDAQYDDIEALKDSLILSDNAREFIVSKCMNQANSSSIWVSVFQPGILILLNYAFGKIVNTLLNKRQIKTPLYVKACGMLALQSFLVLFYFLSKGLKKDQAERDAIENVIRSSDQAQGAIEYYSKCITRNKLLRKILGKDSEYYLQEDGNIVPGFTSIPEWETYEINLERAKYLVTKFESIQAARKKIQERKQQQQTGEAE